MITYDYFCILLFVPDTVILLLVPVALLVLSYNYSVVNFIGSHDNQSEFLFLRPK